MKKRSLQTRFNKCRNVFFCLLLGAVLFLNACGEEPAKTAEGDSVTPVGTTGEPAQITEEEPALSEQAQNEYQFRQPVKGDTCAEFVISGYGSILVRLFPEEAPKAVKNFTSLAEDGYYDNMKIDRVIADYLVQSGSPDGTSGESIYGGGFENEISEKLIPARGALCMANFGEDGTNTSQFFLVQTKSEVVRALAEPLENRYHMSLREYFNEAYQTELSEEELKRYETYGGAPWLSGHHTVFGQIYDGYSVLDQLSEAKVTSKLKPNPSITIETVRIFTFEG